MEEKTNFKTVDEYIASFPENIREGLILMRETIVKAAPNAKEVISYKMPAYKLNGMLVYFAAFKDHYSLFAMPKANDVFKDRLKPYKQSKGTIQFPFGEPLPTDLISEIVKYRVIENQDNAFMKKLKGL